MTNLEAFAAILFFSLAIERFAHAWEKRKRD